MKSLYIQSNQIQLYMSKIKFENEYEMRASQKILYPYLNTPSGLAQWFADDVKIDEDKVFHFFWNDEQQRARLSARRNDHYVRFDYLPAADQSSGSETSDNGESPYIEFLLEKNEITQSVFLKVTDCTEMDDEEEWHDLWDGMISTLRETVGG